MAKQFDPHAYATALCTDGYASDQQMLYRWSGTHWEVVDNEGGEAAAYRWIVEHDRGNATPRNASNAHRAAILWANPLPPLSGDMVIPCRNGYILPEESGIRLIAPDSALGMRHALEADYLPEAVCAPRFQAFLARILPDAEVRARVQEYVGYTLTGDTRYQRAQFWLGSGANGKGVLANIVQALHGRPATVQLDALDGFGLSNLIGASLIYCDEAPCRRINEQLLKSMIAGESVRVDIKYRNPVSARMCGKWLVLGNHLPAITDHSTGFWRRWDIVPFTVTIPERERDPLLAQHILEKELSGVLLWALEGLMRLRRRGAFDPVLPAAMQAVLHEAKADTNSVQAWFDEAEISFGYGAETGKNDVYLCYRAWCERNGLLPLASPRFWTRLRDIGPVEESRRRMAGSLVRLCNVQLPLHIASGSH